MARTPRLAVAPVLLTALAVLTACSGSRDDDATPPSTSEAVASTTPPTSEAPTTTRRSTTTTERATTTTQATTTTSAPPTTVAATSAPTGPPTTVAADPAPLRSDGWSTVPFGTEAEAAIAAATAQLGAATADTGWLPPLDISTCGGTQVRRVTWGSLSLLLGDQSDYLSGSPHLIGWSYGTVDGVGGEPVGLVTAEDLGLGDTVADLRVAYPSVVVTPGEEGLLETTFSVDGSLGGLLTGDTDADTVTVLSAGPYCG